MKHLFSIIFLFLLFEPAFSQTANSDKAHYLQKISSDNRSGIVQEPYHFKYNGIGNLLLNFYQKVLTVQISGECFYHPSCSRYARKSINKYGLLIGTLATGDRLTRCVSCSANDTPLYKFDKNGYVHDEP